MQHVQVIFWKSGEMKPNFVKTKRAIALINTIKVNRIDHLNA